MAVYSTWAIIERGELALETLFASMARKPVDPSVNPVPPARLERVGLTANLTVVNSTQTFKSLTQGTVIRAITSLSRDDLEFQHGKRFQHFNTQYLLIWDAGNPKLVASWLERLKPEQQARLKAHFDERLPYRGRFISIVDLGTSAPDTVPPLTSVSSAPKNPNLWIRPELLNFVDDEIRWFLPGGVIERLQTSFILPPCRLDEDPHKGGSYFNSTLVHLRSDLIAAMMRDTQAEDKPLFDLYGSPTCCTMVSLSDEKLIRDVLLEGGALQLVAEEGQETGLRLHVKDSGPGAEAYRHRVIVGAAKKDDRLWVREIAGEIGDDINSLIPSPGLEIVSATLTANWELETFARESGDGSHQDGSWKYLNRLYKRLEASKFFWKNILQMSIGDSRDSFHQHDKADKLFLHYAWRCPWPYVRRQRIFDAWREAYLRLLVNEFQGKFLRPEEFHLRFKSDETGEFDGNSADRNEYSTQFLYDRVVGDPRLWRDAVSRLDAAKVQFEAARSSYGENHPEYLKTEAGLSEAQRAVDRKVFVLQHEGDPEDDEILYWRLLLPFRSVVQARTLILDRPSRSKLDRKFVLV